jgi:hypothetical protein
VRTELILTDEEIDRVANKVMAITDKKRNLNSPILAHGLIREFKGIDLWFEPIADTKDGFVLRDKNNGSVLGIFPEQE